MANPHADPSAQGSNASRLLSFLLALLMHVGLGTLLFVGIDWQKPQPEVVQAELWIPMEDLPAPEEVPEAPAPEPKPQPTPEPPPPRPAPAPEPEPAKADLPDPAIAIAKAKEEAERKAEEERRHEEEKRRLAEEEKKRQEAEARERERARQAELERQRAEEKRQREEALRKEQERKAEEARKEAERKAAEEKQREEQKKQEEVRQRKLAQEKAEREKAEKEKAEKAEKAAAQKAAAEKAAAQRQAAEARRKAAVSALLSQAGDADSTTIHGSTSGARDAGYAARVSSAIRNNTTFFQQISGNPKAVFDVRLDRDGRIQDVRLKHSSGNAAWDSAAERAIRRTDPFPCPRSGSCESTLEIHHGPQD